MALDLLLGPDGDYVDDGAGGFEMTETASSAVRHAVLDELDAWPGDPNAGRRKAAAGYASEDALDLEAEDIRVSLARLAADGLIRDVEVEVERAESATRAIFRSQCRDAGSGAAIDLDTLGEVGG